MTWGDFWSQLVIPFAEEDPDFDPAAARAWSLHGQSLTPSDDQTLEQLGVVHKDVLAVTMA
jgi:phenol hydroxylase P4 protein